MTLGSLYAGEIDAFGYAAQMLGIEVKWQVEKVYAAHSYLKKKLSKCKTILYR